MLLLLFISIYKRLTSVYFKFVCVINYKFVNATLFDIARIINFLNLSRLLIKNLYVIFLNFKFFHFLYVSLFYNFVNYKIYFTLFNVVKITLFKSLFNVLNLFLCRNTECVSRLYNKCFNVLYNYVLYKRVHYFIYCFKYIYINIFTLDIPRTHVLRHLRYIYFFYPLFTARINVIKRFSINSFLLKIEISDRLL